MALLRAALAIVEECKRKIHAYSLTSRDPLVPVFAKGADAMYAVLKSTDNGHIQRALESLDAERSLCFNYEESKKPSHRFLSYGLIQSIHLAFKLLTDEEEQSEESKELSIAFVEEWKKTTLEVSLLSEDTIIPVYSKLFDAAYFILKEADKKDIKRTLESLENERLRCLQYEKENGPSIRSLTFALIESAQSSLLYTIEVKKPSKVDDQMADNCSKMRAVRDSKKVSKAANVAHTLPARVAKKRYTIEAKMSSKEDEVQEKPSEVEENVGNRKRVSLPKTVVRPVEPEESDDSEEDEPTMKRNRVESNNNKEKTWTKLDSPNSGVIRFEVENVSKLEARFSSKIEVGGLPWRARIEKEKGNDEVSIYLYGVGAYGYFSNWNIEMNIDFLILNADSAKNIVELHSDIDTFGDGDRECGCIFDEITWKDLMDVKKGFIHDDKITFEIRFTIVKSNGIRIAPQIDFKDPNVPHHDVALMIEREKIFVNKGLLAQYSPIFNEMFYGTSQDKTKKVFELKNVTKEEFLEMLQVICPSHEKITDENAIFLLKLGDQFKITYLIDLCETHLMAMNVLKSAQKLLLSEKFRLFNLQDHCISLLRTKKDMKKLKKSSAYEQLSDGLKDRLRSTRSKIKKGTFIPFD